MLIIKRIKLYGIFNKMLVYDPAEYYSKNGNRSPTHYIILLICRWCLSFVCWFVFRVFFEFVVILLLFYVLVFWPRGMWDLSSLTRDQTRTPCIGKQSPNHWTTREVPVPVF